MTKITTYLALKAIVFYQRCISPYKGFSCSLRVLTDEKSCSGYGATVIERFGVWKGYKLLQRRFMDCAWASRQLSKQFNLQNSKPHVSLGTHFKHQKGSVDCPDLDCLDAADCCDIPDCGNKKSSDKSDKRDKKNQKKYAEHLD